MDKNKILWIDDEIDLLRSHMLFLKEKGYEVTPINNGQDALDIFRENDFNIVFLDENMPGLSGMETLRYLKEINPSVPVVMITKNEDEGIMTDAIGKKITDYLIKPVNPHQILHSLKKNLDKDEIISEATLDAYREEYTQVSTEIEAADTFDDWIEIHKKLFRWELELSASQNALIDLLRTQREDANKRFSKYIKVNYETWMNDKSSRPPLSHDIFQQKVLPLLNNEESVFWIVIDNFRLDQWMVIRDLISPYFTFVEDCYCSILPTATQYARNSLFSGLTPNEIHELYPQYWVGEEDEEGKNLHEEELIGTFFERFRKPYTYSYNKIATSSLGEKYIHQISNLKEKNLNVLVINFIDMLSHLRTESKMIRELAADESAYRSLTQSWFKHSSAVDIFKKIANLKCKVVLTTDHGTIRVDKPLKIVGEKDLNTNLRYKAGRQIDYNRKKVYDILKPEKVGLPSPFINTKYIFATEDNFFAYPNNFNYYVSYFTDTFQHGGISMEEMIIPFITMTPK